MTNWIRDPNSKHLNRLETNIDNSSESKPESQKKKMGEAWPQPRVLKDMYYPSRTIEPSCFNAPALESDTFELKPQYTHILPKFTSIEDAYLFLREFK